MCTFFLDAGNIYQENECFSPKVATYVGFLSDVWKDPPRVTVWLTKNRFFNGKMCIFGHLGPGNTHFCSKNCIFFLDAGNIYQENVCFSPKVATYVGFLSDVWKDPPRVTVWLTVVGT